jgi:hypothetical protein
MPDLRIITWNSGGEADGRGAALTAFANAINALFYNPAVAGSVPVQIVTTQEAYVGGGGAIAVALAAAPFNNFINPHGHVREHLAPGAGQPFRVGVSKAYRLAWMNTDPTAALNLGPAAAAPVLVNLDPAVDAGVAAWIAGFGMPAAQANAVSRAAANMRWPVYQALTYAGNNVHLFTWHVELRANWLGANFLGPIVNQGLPEAFMFFQNSTFYTALIAGLGANDLVIIAGDLNATAAEMTNPNFFPNFVGITDNLTHILAFSPNGVMNLVEHQAQVTPYPPHCIVTARINW